MPQVMGGNSRPMRCRISSSRQKGVKHFLIYKMYQYCSVSHWSWEYIFQLISAWHRTLFCITKNTNLHRLYRFTFIISHYL